MQESTLVWGLLAASLTNMLCLYTYLGSLLSFAAG